MIDIRKSTAKLIKENLDLDEGTTQALFDIGLLDVTTSRNVLIRDEWQRCINFKRKTDLKVYLADKYALSYSAIEKIISGT